MESPDGIEKPKPASDCAVIAQHPETKERLQL